MISVSIICINSLRMVERWLLSYKHHVNRKSKKKHHGTIRNMIAASSHVLSLSPEGVPSGYISLG